MAKRRPYTTKNIAAAHRWLAKSLDALEEARALAGSGRTRVGAYNRLYYCLHHVSLALLRLIGSRVRKHTAIRSEFGRLWVKNRGFPKLYGKLLKRFYEDRVKADYGAYVPTMERDIEKRIRQAERFIKRAGKEIPPVSTSHILGMLVSRNPEIRDFSFDVYCPKSYYHHTRFTVWFPKGRVSDQVLSTLLGTQMKSLQQLRVEEWRDYVLGLNSRVNQYAEKHLVMLDFDDVSTIPYERFKDEPGFFFRTGSGFHFIGSQLYSLRDWKKKMRAFSKIASKQHFDLSMKRGYATLRLTRSARKPVTPAFVGESK